MTEEKKQKLKSTKKSASDEKKMENIIKQLESQHNITKITGTTKLRVFQYNGKNVSEPLEERNMLPAKWLANYVIVRDKGTGFSFCINTTTFHYDVYRDEDIDDLGEIITELTAEVIKAHPNRIINILKRYATFITTIAILLDREDA